MNCFSFKGRCKSKHRSESAPELDRRDGLSGTSGASERAVKSLSSMPSTPRSIPELYKEKEHTLRVFSYDELSQATVRFNRMHKIGEGGFGSVYKGTIRPEDGKGEPFAVAVKKLNSKSLQGHKEWISEVQFLSVVNHPNLVKLLGYSSFEGERGIQLLLVYEYMANRSLDDHLFGKSQTPMPWKTRLEIILGAAQGLAYLHQGMEVQVIFRDFKSSNILLDENFKAKLSDFGMAREGPVGDRTHVTTRIVGTYGYAAPEYVETGHLTIHSDIWTFGVVLYEIITGRRAVERTRPLNEQKLLDWVKGFPVDSRKFTMIIDPKLRNQYPISSARKVARIAELCLSKNPKDRPTMGQIVAVLKDAIRDCDGENSSGSGSVKSPPGTGTTTRHLGAVKKIIGY